MVNNPECIRCGQRVGWVGVLVNLIMVLLKFIIGIQSGSRACLADGLHSASNIVTAFAIFVSRKLINKPCNEAHPYGHGNVEFIAAALVSALILVLTLGLVIVSFKHLLYNPVPPPHLSALLVAISSIITNEMLFRYFRCVGTRLRSQTILANAWANRADCFSSVAVVVGVVGARLGFHHLDPIAALVVTIIIVKVCISSLREAIAGLMDRSVPPETLGTLKKLVAGVDVVRGINHLRARLLGDKIWIDVGVRVSRDHTVNECEGIRQRIQRQIQEGIVGVGQVQIDFEPVGD